MRWGLQKAGGSARGCCGREVQAWVAGAAVGWWSHASTCCRPVTVQEGIRVGRWVQERVAQGGAQFKTGLTVDKF